MTFLIQIESQADPDHEIMLDYDDDNDLAIAEFKTALLRLPPGMALTVTHCQEVSE